MKDQKDISKMIVCRTCLLLIENTMKYSLDVDTHNTRKLQLGIMVAKCMPEMDLDITDSPVICKRCYELLLSAYIFRKRCVQTEEKIYQYIENNNLRLGESIDLSNLYEKNPYKTLDAEIEEAQVFINEKNGNCCSNSNEEVGNTLSKDHDELEIVKENSQLEDESCDMSDYGEMPDLIPEVPIENENEHTANETMSPKADVSVPCSENNVATCDSISEQTSLNTDNSVSGSEKNAETSDSGSEYSAPKVKKKRIRISRKTEKPLKRSFTCDKCEYKAYDWELLKRHVTLKCKANGTKRFKCEKCSYTTMRQWHLKRHDLVHGGDRPWICSVCKMGFSEKYALSRHMLKHSDKPLPYQCHEKGCSFSCARKYDLSVHLVRHMKKLPLVCDRCKVSFLTKQQLKKHQNNCKKS